ncbi:MAG: single-stranded DNA-binding protein [Saprospiraceae bacterium]|nr:single-stranded DNA-binding protein [Saprospiraceae bacterium]
MNNLRNSVRLFGKVGMDPEVVTFENGKKKAKLSLATTETYKNQQGEKVRETQWHNLVAWGAQAATIEKFVEKGREIAIEGKLVHRNYEDKTGKKCFITEIVLNEFIFTGSPNKEKAQ